MRAQEVQGSTYFHPMNFSNCSHCHPELAPQKTHSYRATCGPRSFCVSRTKGCELSAPPPLPKHSAPHPCRATPFQPVAPHRPRAALTQGSEHPAPPAIPILRHTAARSLPSSFQAGARQQQCRQGGCAQCTLHSLPPRCLGQRNKKEADARKRRAG